MRAPSPLTALLAVRKRALEDAKAALRGRQAEASATQQRRDACTARLAQLRAVKSPPPHQFADVRDMQAAVAYEQRNAGRLDACLRELARLDAAVAQAERAQADAAGAAQRAHSALQAVERRLQERALASARTSQARDDEDLDELHAQRIRGRNPAG